MKKNPLIGRREWILLLVVLLISILLALYFHMRNSGPAAIAEISQNGTVLARLDLSEDQEYTITGENGARNVLVIENGKVWMKEASCPDHLCIRQGKISMDGQMIVCLPNYIVISIRES